MMYSLSFPRAYNGDRANGYIKTQPEDFVVIECMDEEWAGEGEHDYLWLEKRGQNTDYIARQLARFAGLREMDVSFSGLKDRQAVTRQWFSVYRRGGRQINWAAFEHEGVSILDVTRHSRKLRRGEHRANQFRIVVRGLDNVVMIEQRAALIAEQGFPNYFGEQRFGRDGANLQKGERFFAGKLKASRSQRGYYLSAARAFLFNLNLAQAIVDGVWQEVGASGPLYGDPQEDVAALTEAEALILAEHPMLAKGIHANRLRLERRAYCIRPESFTWAIDEDVLTLDVVLPAGVFATALLAELLEFETVAAQENSQKEGV